MIGQKVTVKIDRPLGSYHPEHRDMYYPINYGYIEGIMAPDGEEQDAYILGVDEPVEEFTGVVIATIHRFDDIEEKWVVVPENTSFSREEIEKQVHFQEQYFRSEIRMMQSVKSEYFNVFYDEKEADIMATWVTHLMVADEVIKQVPFLCRHEFFVGNIAPDCNVENEDWTSFTPSREVTHWMGNERKTAADCDRFLHEYVESKENMDIEEESFLLGYYAHLITDAEFQRYIRDAERVKACWDRIKQHPELSQQAVGMDVTWDSVKKLINGRERMKDMYSMEAEYLETHPESGYITDIVGLEEFPDYIDYLPKGAIARKVKVMGYMPEKEIRQYPYIGMSKEEYSCFVNRATELVVEAIERYRNNRKR